MSHCVLRSEAVTKSQDTGWHALNREKGVAFHGSATPIATALGVPPLRIDFFTASPRTNAS